MCMNFLMKWVFFNITYTLSTARMRSISSASDRGVSVSEMASFMTTPPRTTPRSASSSLILLSDVFVFG